MERDIIKLCVSETPTAAHGLQDSEANDLGQTDRQIKFEPQTCRQTDLQSGSYCCIWQLKMYTDLKVMRNFSVIFNKLSL